MRISQEPPPPTHFSQLSEAEVFKETENIFHCHNFFVIQVKADSVYIQ
jgi:hypothetical protein